MTYSLIAHAPYEAWMMSINGSLGRLEIEADHSGKIIYVLPKARGGHGRSGVRLEGESHEHIDGRYHADKSIQLAERSQLLNFFPKS